jgi:formate hydrogenlyase subunit 3/multisubunit Na+/H+ antiporter MnhD subunit
VLGSGLGLVPVLGVLAGGSTQTWRCEWAVPGGEFHVTLDALSAWFLLPTLGLSALAAIYGSEYLAAWRGRKALGASWLFFNGLVASMGLVMLARNAVLFLVAWEVMALASFFLVTFEDEQDSVRDAGWIYLVATHLGTACLLALFVMLGRETGTMDLERWAAAGTREPGGAAGLFVLAVLGFGAKAGFLPLHVWLPEAHPAAPSHVSALMSGVMIKTGIYGLLRALTFLGPPPLWWGWVLIGIGLTSGVVGVLFALAQRDLKRLLAYSSVENIGFIALGLGLGLVGASLHSPWLMLLGLSGALWHVVNHALFKGLLFLGAGSVLHGAGTRDIDRLGGLLKRMPWTGAAFLVGAVAIAGLPPLNGFISELFLLVGAYRSVAAGGTTAAVAGLAVLTGLALISGLTAACFTKAFGIAFLGEPRSECAARAHEVGWAMRGPMMALAAACVGLGLCAPLVARLMVPALAEWTRLPVASVHATLAPATRILTLVVASSLMLLALVCLLTALRRWLLTGRNVTTAVTWDCGYAAPTARMQYTASSFAQPLTHLLQALLRTRARVTRPDGILPRGAALATETPDLCRDRVYQPAFFHLNEGLAKLRWLQHGNVQLYVLYIALTLLALLLWKLR